MPAPASVLALIGNTPMLELTGFDAGPCRIFLKLENQNPGGSIKDRMALSMIDAAERAGELRSGDAIVEATAGNTGLGLAVVAAVKGYRLFLAIPDKMSTEKIAHLRALGAEIHITRSDVGPHHAEYYANVAQRLAQQPRTYWVNQFANPANPVAHEQTTGPEIWEQMDYDVDAIVCGVGSGGTLTGLSRYFARVQPRLEMILADPEGSSIAPYVKTGNLPPSGSYAVEGIGGSCIPEVADLSRVREAYAISDAESFETARELLKKVGVLAGSSSGTLLAAALRYSRKQTTPKRVVTFVCDSGNKYLSKMFNDYWMIDQGYIHRPSTGTLRDLITRRYEEGAVITVGPEDPLLTAFQRMRIADISQVPVIEHGKPIGILDESDLLVAVHGDPSSFNQPVRVAMTSRLETLPVEASLDDVQRVLARNLVALIVDHDQFLGLITRADLLSYLRRRVK